MSNPCNFGTIVGHAASKPRFFENRAGGATVKLGIFARNSFASKATGEVESEVAELTGYIADVSTGHGAYDHINTGDRVAVSYSLKTDRFITKDGVEQFQLTARIDTVQLLDSKSGSAARAARRNTKTRSKAPVMTGVAASDDPPF